MIGPAAGTHFFANNGGVQPCRPINLLNIFFSMKTTTPNWIKNNVLLKDYSTIKIGGPAKYFVEVNNKEHLKEISLWLKQTRLPFFILGNGSNILFSEQGFKGVIIKITNNEILKEKKNSLVITAGYQIGEFLNYCANNGISGYEWMSGIPGTIGGAVRGNAGAFGYEIKDLVLKVKTINIKTLKEKIYSNKDCHFSYRESIFKNKSHQNEIIWEIELKKRFGDKNLIASEIQKYWQYKIEHHMFDYPSLGSVFKNIVVEQTPYKKFYDKKNIKVKILDEEVEVKGGKISAGYFIEKCGLRGYQIGGAKIADFHANVIINVKNAKAKDVLRLINLIKNKVYRKFKIKLEEEIIVVK